MEAEEEEVPADQMRGDDDESDDDDREPDHPIVAELLSKSRFSEVFQVGFADARSVQVDSVFK